MTQNKNSYNGNRSLKQIGYNIEYTYENIQEILKCKDDPVYFIKTYCKIVSLDSEMLIPFELFGYQEKFINLIQDNRRVISMQPRQMGKALDIETEIPTPNGFVKMKDLGVGDTVYDMYGNPTKITFKSETHNKPTYKITFSDNTNVVCCEDHLWHGFDYHGSNKYRKEHRVFSTKQMVETGLMLYNSDREYRYAVPLCNPVNYPVKDLPIDPYLLGLWLGDGSSDDGVLTMLEEDFDNIKHLIPLECEIRRYNKKNQNILYIKVIGLRDLLKKYDLLKNKHIPTIYLNASIDQRRQLLAGLMDTDGYSDGTTLVSITQALFRENLLLNIKELISSLGYKVSEYVYNSEHPSKTLRFCAYDIKSFNLERKSSRQKLTTTSKSRKKQIVKIEKIDNLPTQCITVDTPTHTFLCTRDYTVTHNSQVVAAYILWYTLFNNNKTVAILGNKSDAAMEILSRYQLMYENLPIWMQQGIKTWNKGDVDLENGSSVFTAATSSAGIRGKSVNLLYVDEVAIIPNNIAEQFFTSVYPVVSAGETTKIILTSTPLGYNHFWKFWNDAENGINGFKPLRVEYWEHPNRDDKWAAEQKAILGEIKFNQEVLCVGGDTKITLRDTVTKDILQLTMEEAYSLLYVEEKSIRYNTRYEILTPHGFKNFSGIIKQNKPGIKFLTNKGSITVSNDHAFIIAGNVRPSKEVKIGDYFSKIEYVTGITFIDNVELYDPLDVQDIHVYFGNDIEHHNCAFLGSSNTLINADTIARLSPMGYTHSKDNLDILKEPVKGRSYFITVDTSRGVGGDYSAFTVIDTTDYPYEIVAKYRDNKISPLLYPNIIHKVAKDYNSAYILVEINDIGQQVADIIHNDLEYENMIWVGSDSRHGQYLSSSGRQSHLGVRTTKQIKRIGCATLKSLVENNKLLVFDKDIISEFSTFIEHSGSFEADEGYHDDLTMTLVLFAWASNDMLFRDMMNSNNRQALYNQQIRNIEEELTPFGFINDGTPEELLPEVVDGDLWLSDKYQKDLSDFIRERSW